MPKTTNGTTAQAHVAWLVVPHGAGRGPNLLDIGLRALPGIGTDPMGADVPFDELADWPSCVSRIRQLTLCTDEPSNPCLEPINLGATYLAQLACLSVSVDQASRLWKKLFGKFIESAEGMDTSAVRATRLRSNANEAPVEYHRSSDLAKVTRARLGHVLAESLTQAPVFNVESVKRKTPGRVVTAAPGQQGARWLRQAAALYAPPGRHQQSLAEIKRLLKIDDGHSPETSPGGGSAPSYRSAATWAETVLSHRATAQANRRTAGSTSGTSDPGSPAYSVTCLKYLLTYAGSQGASSQCAVLDDETDLDEFALRLVERRFAYAGDVAEPEAQCPNVSNEGPASLAARLAALLAAITAHPWLARILGLVVDLQCDVRNPVECIAQIGVKCFSIEPRPQTPSKPRSPGPEPADCATGTGTPVPEQGTPGTGAGTVREVSSVAATILSGGFAVALFGDDHSSYYRGLLNVASRDDAFLLTQVDVDRTPENYLQSAVSYETQLQAGQVIDKIAVGLQPQESVGFALIEKDTSRQTCKQQAFDRLDKTKVYLEHLLMGYIPDAQLVMPLARGGVARYQPWQSLCNRRIRRVELDGEDITDWFRHVGDVQGHLVDSTRTATQDSTSTPFLEGELFRWSMSGLGSGPRSSQTATEICGCMDMDQTRELDGRLRIEYDAVDAPPQRFGMRYRFGVRLAMVDGRSIRLEDAVSLYERQDDADRIVTIGDDLWHGVSDAPRLAPAVCQRFESVGPPGVLLVTPPCRHVFAKESAEHIIVSSSRSPLHKQAQTQRVLVPPRCARPEFYLRHGVFDAVRNETDWPSGAFVDVVRTPKGDFPAERFAFTGVDSAPGKQASQELYFRRLNGTASSEGLVRTPVVAPYYPDPWATRVLLGFYRSGDDCLLGAEYFDYYDEAHGRRWPDCQPLHLVVKAATQVDHATRGFDVVRSATGLTVHLMPGQHLVMRAWHEMDRTRLRQSGIVDQIAQLALDPDNKVGQTLLASLGLSSSDLTDLDAIRDALVDRLASTEPNASWASETPRPSDEPSALVNLTSFWMLNPSVEMQLVHAVDVPFAPLALADNIHGSVAATAAKRVFVPATTADAARPFDIVRAAGATSATFAGHLLLNRMTTARVDATAHWLDNASGASRQDKRGRYVALSKANSTHLFGFKDIAAVADDDGGAPPLQPLAPELSTAAYLQDLAAPVPVRLDDRAAATPAVSSHDFGDTRARVIDVVLTGVSRDAGEYAGLDASKTVRVASGQRAIVRSTKRPSPPAIDYVVPVFNWTAAQLERGQQACIREGGWFRVWLGSDWYSSGNGELLALVCWPGNLLSAGTQSRRFSSNRATAADVTPIHPAVEPYVTRWGLDPVMMETIGFGNLPAAALSNRITSLADIAAADGPVAQLDVDLHHLQDVQDFEPRVDLSLLPEFAGATFGPAVDGARSGSQVQLALFRPRLDEETGRMYADLRIDPQLAYQPFVRLALARYQPYALHADKLDLRLSTIVCTEFVQLMPERAASVTLRRKESAAKLSLSIAISGTALPDALGEKADVGLARSTFRTTLEERPIDAQDTIDGSDDIDGAWIPVGAGSEDRPLGWDARERLWQTDLDFQPHVGRRYSVRIEEYEYLAGERVPDRGAQAADPPVGRLVYFDRIAVTAY